MPELRRLAEELFNREHPLVPTPPMADVAGRAQAYRQRRQVRLTALAVAGLLVVSAIVLPTVGGADDDGQELRTADGTNELPVDLPPGVRDLLPLPTSTTTSTSRATTTSTTSTTTRPGGGGPGPETDACPGGQNAGATDVGVTATEIKVLVRSRGATGAGTQAAINKLNYQGGVCGRRIAATFVIEPSTANPNDFFAVLADYRDGIPDGIPVVGTDGLVKQEFQSGWSWPVGTPTAAQARVMAKHAWDTLGARTFAIVYDNQQRFGLEARAAYQAYVQQLGGQLVAETGLASGKASYASEAQEFASACDNKCDAVVFAVLPSTANVFIRALPNGNDRKQGFGLKITSGMSPLVSTRFAQECGTGCNGMHLWSPYAPPVGENNSNPDVAAYVNDVRSMDPDIDTVDQSVEHSYVAAKVFIAALQKTGANLTRSRLRSALDAMTYTSGLSAELRWDGDRVANNALQALQIRTVQGSFAGFQNDSKFWFDPTPGVFP